MLLWSRAASVPGQDWADLGRRGVRALPAGIHWKAHRRVEVLDTVGVALQLASGGAFAGGLA